MNVPAAEICAITSCDDTGILQGSLTETDVPPSCWANDYFAFFTPLFVIPTLFENACGWLDLRALASGFVISARKP